MKVISFSLWGDNPKYTIGAIRNAELAATWYKGWKCRFYCDEETVSTDILDTLESMPNCEVVRISSSKVTHWGGFWRFYAAEDLDVDFVIFRDTDSRLGHREAMAVCEWIGTGKVVHVMRDHPLHGVPICAGMWGVSAPKFRDIREKINDYYREGVSTISTYGDIDQDFLKRKIWDIFRNQGDILEHDEFFAKQPFPTPRDPKHFVGQVYDENDNPQY